MSLRSNSIRDPCGHCALQVKDDGHGALQCHRCDFWIHLKCTSVPGALLTHLKKVQGLVWLCESCESPAKEALFVSSPKVDEVRKLREKVDELKKNFVSVNEVKRDMTEIKSLVNSSSSEVNNIKIELSKPKPRPTEPTAVTAKLLANSILGRSILVLLNTSSSTFQSQWDKRMALSKSYMLKNTEFFLKPMLTPENEPWRNNCSICVSSDQF